MSNEYIKNKIKKITRSIFSEIVCIRRWIHQHPELSFEEKETSRYICSILEKNNIKYENEVAGYGVVALIECQHPESQVIGVRGDMDALPIQEKNNISYKSIYDGVMHACGHDAHTAVVLGTAIVLNKLKNNLTGTIKCIFQPAEEKLPGGASLMIKEGVLENPKVNKMFALHVFPEFPVGTVGFCSGQYMAACDELSILVKGKGGHAALPDDVINPITIGAEIILNVKHMVSQLPAIKKYILEFGDFRAYGASNVIPNEAKIEGTLRTLDEDFRHLVHRVLIEEVKKIEKKYQANCVMNIIKGYPSLYNDPELTKNSESLSRQFLDPSSVKKIDIRMASEDFSYFSQECPSCFFRLGVANNHIKDLVHTPNFNIDEKSLEIGVGLMSYLVASNLLCRTSV
ncbi:MAG: N-acyl-L-amino acid amidohydrolase [Flavobacteriales bacterium]|nr:N-acyl-L-amino acid amidohydrolase [Flavobacteriales bacterium]